jgi:EpsI family protein
MMPASRVYALRLLRIPASGWTYAALAFGAIVLWPTLASLVRIWGEMTDYRHGYAVLVTAVIWLAMLRTKIDRVPLQTSWLALLALLATLSAWLIAYRGGSELLQQLLLPLVLLSAVAASLGLRIAGLVAAPLGYLYFAVPIWEYAVPVLQHLTATVTEALLAVFNVPASFAGPEVTLPNGQFVIAEDCAGKRYLVVALAFATMGGAIQPLPPKRMLVLLGAAAALALLTNWLRVATIIYLGYLTDMQHYLVAVEHVTFGWAVFVPLLAAILLCAWGLRRRGPRVTAAAVAPELRSAPSAVAAPSRIVLLHAAALQALALILATGIPASASTQRTLDAMPLQTGAWEGPFPSQGWSPRFFGPLIERQAAYVSGGRTVHVYVNLYESQQQGRELVNYRNSVLPADWSASSDSLAARVFADDAVTRVRGARDASGHEWLVASFYNIDGSLVATPLVAQLSYGSRALLHPVPSGMIALASPCQGDCAAAADALQAFWRDNGARFTRMLQAKN